MTDLRTEAGRALDNDLFRLNTHGDECQDCHENYAGLGYSKAILAIETEAFAQGFAEGKRLGDAHGSVASAPRFWCSYDLDSLQPDGWHEIEGEPVNRCCGQYLDSGECCASIYGEARLVPEQTESQRVKCAGQE